MGFYEDPDMTNADVQRVYGRYVKSFESEHAQLRADLFQRGENLIAFVKFSPGYDATNVTDRWISVLTPEAERIGFDSNRFRVVYTGLAFPVSMVSASNAR